jgi:signal transduction histidine kinase
MDNEAEKREVQAHMSSSPDAFLAGGGEMGALMRATDWSKTRLGPIEHWPRSLKTMLGVVLGSRFPMLLWWGPELLHLYNDAYRPILRDKHPDSLAAPAAEIWAEVWDVAGPMARSVQDGGPATWTEDLQLFIKNGTMAEETYFTFSYSPVPGDDGGVGGLLNTVQETTAKVQSERQIRMLRDLAARAAGSKSEEEACRVAAEVLSANELDLPFVLLYLFDAKSGQAHLVAEGGWKDYDGPAKPLRVQIEEVENTGWPFSEALQEPHEILVEDLAARFGPVPMGRWNARPEQAILLPLSRAGQVSAFLAAGLSPHRSFDERYRRFFLATADQVAKVLADASAFEAEKKRAEALEEIDRAKTAFFSNVSHEFRTPLTLLLGLVEEALGRPGAALEGEGLQAAHRSALRLLKLVNSLLDFARIEAGRLQMSFAPVDVSALTVDLASSFRSLVERAGLAFTLDCPPLPEQVYLDPQQWEKIVLNLLSNAFKFTLRGEISVGLRAEEGQVRLSVRDTGSGIPVGELSRIFERFHRVEGTKGRSFEGTGIGLSLVQELVKLHGGTLQVSSVEGQGSCFEVSLPTSRAHLPVARTLDQAEAPAAGGAMPYLLDASQWIGSGQEVWESVPPPQEVSPERKLRAGRARVLVVDDNADMRDYLARLLVPRWQVETAEDGLAALTKAREEPPDLVLSDVMMPGLDGFGLLRALREHPPTSQVPIILLSARAGEEAVLEGLETGADDYLVKPFAARELLARVQAHLELSRLRREWAKELERVNEELETFSYSVSHDLRGPLRAIGGFSKALQDGYADRLDEQGRHYLERVQSATRRMSQLIEALLGLARLTRSPLNRERVDITSLAREILVELGARDPERAAGCQVEEGLEADADPRLIAALLENLLGNAWKYSSKEASARIEVGREPRDGEAVFFVRDNGVGFDMAHAKGLFTPFQRLHSDAQFEGTGIGLVTVQRIVARHGGRVWAEASPGRGATFFFTLEEQP